MQYQTTSPYEIKTHSGHVIPIDPASDYWKQFNNPLMAYYNLVPLYRYYLADPQAKPSPKADDYTRFAWELAHQPNQ